MSPLGFEIELATLFRKFGYKASLTAATGDEGVDIVLVKDGRTTVVQCKAHKNPVGVHSIRDLHGALMHSNADDAILACTSGFTSGVIAYAEGKAIRLLSLDDIIEMADRDPTLPTAPL